MPKIKVPKPAPGSFNKHRPISDLLRWQLKHMHEIEMRLPFEHRSGVNHHEIKTEHEASVYIRKVTAKIREGVHLRYVVRVPKPAHGSMNKYRPMSHLLRSQVSHFHEVEKSWPANTQTGIDIRKLKTESDAAGYIRRITAVLHPEGARRKG